MSADASWVIRLVYASEIFAPKCLRLYLAFSAHFCKCFVLYVMFNMFHKFDIQQVLIAFAKIITIYDLHKLYVKKVYGWLITWFIKVVRTNSIA